MAAPLQAVRLVLCKCRYTPIIYFATAFHTVKFLPTEPPHSPDNLCILRTQLHRMYLAYTTPVTQLVTSLSRDVSSFMTSQMRTAAMAHRHVTSSSKTRSSAETAMAEGRH